MKINSLILFFIILTTFNAKSNKLSDNFTFRGIFNAKEIVDLQKLFDFFNEYVCETIDNRELTDCYKSFCIKIDKAKETGEFPFKIPFEKQREVYNEISKSTFKEIWSFGISRFRDFPNYTFQTVYINPKGKYLKFLKEVGKENEALNEYCKTVENLGDVMQFYMLQHLLINEKIDLNDIRVKFIIAINILTLNDESERKDKKKDK